MKIFLIICLSLLLQSSYAQRSVIYILDSLAPNDIMQLNKGIEKYNIEFKTGEPDDLIANNYKTISALEKVNKNWFSDIDKELKESVFWKKIKKTNSEDREITGEYYEFISFWDFGLIKKYQHYFIGKVGSRSEPIKRESNYTKDGVLKK